MATTPSETVTLLTELLLSHQHARDTYLAAGDDSRAVWHEALATQLRAEAPPAVSIPELPLSVQLPRPRD